ncbi:MAG: acyl-CoA dehydrogenase [Promethearchaeota archaeon CR_4]|nr:MAG: acyl-CoA dehydrogenase [Candidatus Lokiarchaeota archaeon CR_4]
MDLGFTPEQEKFRNSVREWCKTEITPLVNEMEEKEVFNKGLVEKFKKKFLNMWIPKNYGGSDADTVDICIVAEELGHACGSCLTLLEVGGLGILPIVFGGTEEQKQRFLPPIARGEHFYGFGLTDEGSGSDVANMNLTAVKKDGSWVLNGKKRLISNCDIAHSITVFAKTEPEKGAGGISEFVVDIGTPGFTVGKRLWGWGIKVHHTNELEFHDCIVPADRLIGEENKGFMYAMKTLDRTRLALGAGNVGIARAAFEVAVKFAKERKAFGKPIADNQAISFRLAEVATDIEAARLLAYKAAWLDNKKVRHTTETSMAKWYACATATRAAETAVHILGGYGWSKDYPVMIQLHDALGFTNAQGTAEIHKLIISRSFLE